MENIEKIKAELQALNEGYKAAVEEHDGEWYGESVKASSQHGWWDTHAVHTCGGNVPYTVATQFFSLAVAEHVAEAHEALPKLTDALARVLKIADGLDSAAAARDREALVRRQKGEYDMADAHHKSANRMRAVQRMIVEEIAEAFGLDADDTKEEGENNEH